ncbi:MAG: glycosyltransferase family 39 protein [Chloroflexota bacterium]|nr:glycosyltransferase family 39 protein [Chloroflexota bacterium]
MAEVPTARVIRLVRERPWRVAEVLIGLYVLGVLPSLGQSLLESHAFRQTQTAYTAFLYAEHGIDLLRPPLPVLGPPGIIPLEFPLFQAAGALFMNGGLGADLAMRITGLTSFAGTAVLVFVLARRLLSPIAALVALAAFLFNAQAWVYGRASLIEYLAAGSGVAFLLLAMRWTDTGRARHWVLAMVAGALGMLVKITTGGFYLLPALFLKDHQGRWGFQSPGMWALVGGAGVAGLAWSAYAQGVRMETPAAAFLSVQNQPAWLFGTLSQRLDPGEWRVPLVAMLMLTGSGLVVWGPLAVLRARVHRRAAFALALVGMAIAPPLVLFNLYAVHDYYFAAVAPLVAIGIGLGVEWLTGHRARRWARRTIVGLAGAWVASMIGFFPTWSIIYGTPPEEDRALRISGFIEEHSAPSDWVVVRGLDWNASFLYYARRQGLSVPNPSTLQDTSTVDWVELLTDPRLGPDITCDRDAGCQVVNP